MLFPPLFFGFVSFFLCFSKKTIDKKIVPNNGLRDKYFSWGKTINYTQPGKTTKN